MKTIILDGKETSLKLKNDLKEKLDGYYAKGLPECKLAIIMVGNIPASEVYVRNKTKSCAAVGIVDELIKLDENVSQKDLENHVKKLAEDNSVHGILVQLPLSAHLDESRVTELVPAKKDVDGFTTSSLGKLAIGEDTFISCTPGGIVYMLKHYGVPLSGKQAVIIGRSKIVGKPLALALLNENCTVTVCHSKTENLKDITRTADILVAAIGKAEFVTADMVKEGAVVVDVGINRTENGLKGDVDFASVAEKCSYITPVPGGVGPMTVAYLMSNTVKAYENSVVKKIDL